MSKPDFITEIDYKLLEEKYPNMKKIDKLLLNNYPVQYLIGNVDFCGYKIEVNKNVLIPRFETEELVEKTINYLNKYSLCDTNVLDIGTGSGCISIVLKDKIPTLNVKALEKSKKAFEVAVSNAKLNNVELTLVNEDIYKYYPTEKYGLIISNPPYVAYDEGIDPKVKHEPKMAVFADDEGMEILKYIIDISVNMVEDKSIIAFEMGCRQGDALKEYARRVYPNAIINVEKDLSGRDRFLFIINE